MPFDSPDATRPSPRWTPSRIAKEMRCPKPKGAVGKALAYEKGWVLGHRFPTGTEQQILQHIAEHADMLTAPALVDESAAHFSRNVSWLLVPVPQWVIDGLAELGADLEDREDGGDTEGDADSEPDEDLEDGGDAEPEDESWLDVDDESAGSGKRSYGHIR